MNDVSSFMKLACDAAQIGASVLKNWFGRLEPVLIQTKQINDWVSIADKSSEQAILKYFAEMTPDFAILTEEAGYLKPQNNSQYCWIIDPLDGTTNFIRGFPVWAVSIALEHRIDNMSRWGEIIAGAVAIPAFDEVFSAGSGQGAFRNGKLITPFNNSKFFNESLLCTGFPFRAKDYRQPYLSLFGDVMASCANIRRPGAVTIDLCYTATGAFDGFWELDLSPWDIAAGALIVKESGGQICNFQGGIDVLSSGDIVAGRPPAFDELLALTQKYFTFERNVNKSPVR